MVSMVLLSTVSSSRIRSSNVGSTIAQVSVPSLVSLERFHAARAPTPFKRFNKAQSASLLDSASFTRVSHTASAINTFVLMCTLAVDPGLAQVNVCSEELRRVDVKIQIASIGRQTVITRDNVNVEM